MKQEVLNRVTRTVVRQFPEMGGVRPAVKAQGDQYLVTFKVSAELPGGKTMKRIVKVVTDDRGHVVKMSTSR